MKVLLAHNRYQQKGGEDTVYEAESNLLENQGVEVIRYVESNDAINGLRQKIDAAKSSIFNRNQHRKILGILRDSRPDIVHVHNFFPVISPAIFFAAQKCNVPIVMTLHNYRLFCANGLLLRDDVPCVDCIGRQPWRAVVHRCYRGSFIGSATVSSMISYHGFAGTWRHKVDRFIALTEFAADLFVNAGLPREKIRIKGNFSTRSEKTVRDASARKGFVFVGRLSREKGVNCLIDAWERCDLPLTIIGGGPLEDQVKSLCQRNKNVTYIGPQGRGTVLEAVADAKALLLPSTWFENYPMTVVEALSCGTPVIGSHLGAIPHILSHQDPRLLFRPNDAHDLLRAAQFVESVDTLMLDEMIKVSVGKFEAEMTPQITAEKLLTIYNELITRVSF
jgi:glycosyltransferase involved in cell wall biosynthesis